MVFFFFFFFFGGGGGGGGVFGHCFVVQDLVSVLVLHSSCRGSLQARARCFTLLAF